MIVLHYLEKKNEVLNVLTEKIPKVGDDVVLKGRKGKILDVYPTDVGHYHAKVELEIIKKYVWNPLDDKKKRRK